MVTESKEIKFEDLPEAQSTATPVQMLSRFYYGLNVVREGDFIRGCFNGTPTTVCGLCQDKKFHRSRVVSIRENVSVCANGSQPVTQIEVYE